MSSVDERRANFQRYKRDVKARGKPFYPYAMFHDTVMSLVVVSVIFGLAFVWHYTNILGPEYKAKADPGTTSFVPRPDWYFYFLFYLLRIFKWPESVILGTGSSNLGAPDLTAEGAKGKGIKFQIDHLECPSCVNSGSPMPSFASLGEDNLKKLATFLEASKGGK